MTTLTLEDSTPTLSEPKKSGLADPNWCAPSGWPRLHGLRSMGDYGGGEKLMRQLRGKRIKSGPMAVRTRRAA